MDGGGWWWMAVYGGGWWRIGVDREGAWMIWALVTSTSRECTRLVMRVRRSAQDPGLGAVVGTFTHSVVD